MKLGLNLFLLLTITSECLAAGGGHGSIADLKFPFVNFAIFAGILIVALRKPLKNFFDERSVEVSQSFDRAKVKSKEAQLKLELYNKKMSELESEKRKLREETVQEAEQLEKRSQEALNKKIEKLKDEAVNRVTLEKSALLNNLNKELLDKVIGDAKKIIKSNPEFQKKVSTKLLSEL